MKRYLISAALLMACATAYAGNDNANPCGNHGNNCQPSAPTYNEATASAGAIGVGLGVGVGIGQGGDATANGGNASSIANGGTAFGGNANVGDIRNTNTALGGAGGKGGTGIGGNQAQGQHQGQGQQQSNVGINGQSQTSVNGQQQSAMSDQSQSNSNAVDASSRNDNRSQGNTTSTSVSYRSERNAPPVYLGNVAATVSCAGGFNAGSSSTGGAGALGFTWISPDCKQVVAAQNMQSLGMVDVACRIFKATDGYKRAVRRDPSLANVSCTAAK